MSVGRSIVWYGDPYTDNVRQATVVKATADGRKARALLCDEPVEVHGFDACRAVAERKLRTSDLDEVRVTSDDFVPPLRR